MSISEVCPGGGERYLPGTSLCTPADFPDLSRPQGTEIQVLAIGSHVACLPWSGEGVDGHTGGNDTMYCMARGRSYLLPSGFSPYLQSASHFRSDLPGGPGPPRIMTLTPALHL